MTSPATTRPTRKQLKRELANERAANTSLRSRNRALAAKHADSLQHAAGLAETIHTLTMTPEVAADTESAFLRGEESGRKKAAAGLHGQAVALEAAVQSAHGILRQASQDIRGYTVDLTQ